MLKFIKLIIRQRKYRIIEINNSKYNILNIIQNIIDIVFNTILNMWWKIIFKILIIRHNSRCCWKLYTHIISAMPDLYVDNFAIFEKNPF